MMDVPLKSNLSFLISLGLIVAVVSGAFFGVAWSWGFGLMQGKSFQDVYMPGGLITGVGFGIFMGGFMAYSCRRQQVTTSLTDPNRFQSELDEAVKKLKLQLVEH